MEAYEYIRKAKGIPQTESITDLSYSLSIEEVIELMDGYKSVKNNVGLADVMHRREMLIALIHFAYNDKVCVGKEPEEVLDLFLCN